MNIEEKAKAYDEALGWMREMYPCLTDSLREDAEHYFPELAESEDENLKKKSGYYKDGKFWKASTLWNATKNKIPQRVSNRYILQECTWNIGTLQRFANEVKNVQEVSLDYPIILDMNGNILDGAHRVVKAYLEGKDIDIVYLGDDEWPEPDYDEEKAVKESEDERIRKELKEAFEAYDIESTWNGIPIRSIFAWLEKQKEQNGEDEFLEDELSAFLQNYDKEYDDDAAVSDVARHFYEIGKKQNEQKPNHCLYGGDPNVGRCRWCYAACSARLADVHTDEEKEYVRTIKSIISDFIRDKKPENLAYYQRIYDWLDGRHVPFSCGHENGKSTEWAELQSEFRNINEAFEDGKKEVIDHPDKYGLTKQKPVDFPTTDEEVLI